MKTLLLSGATALFLASVACPAALAQNSKPLKRPGAAAKPNIAMGKRVQNGEAIQVGTLYALGSGSDVVNVRIDRIETAQEYTFSFNGEKKRERSYTPERDNYMIVHLTVQNPTAKTLPVFDGSAIVGTSTPPLLYISAVRPTSPESPKGDLFRHNGFNRESNGARLKWDGPQAEFDRLKPGQSIQVFTAISVTEGVTKPPPLLHLNYWAPDPSISGPGTNGEATGVAADTRAKPTLAVLNLSDVKAAAVPAPTIAAATTANASIPYGDPATAGRTAEIGKPYRVGMGADQMEITVESIELASKFTSRNDEVKGKAQTELLADDEFGGRKRQNRFMVIHLLLHNPTKKPQLAFRNSDTRPYVQAAIWEARKTDGSPKDLYPMKDFYTATDHTEIASYRCESLSATDPKNRNYIPAGATMRALLVKQYETGPDYDELLFLRLNYSPAYHAATDLTEDARRGQDVDAKEVAATLLTFPIRDKVKGYTPGKGADPLP